MSYFHFCHFWKRIAVVAVDTNTFFWGSRDGNSFSKLGPPKINMASHKVQKISHKLGVPFCQGFFPLADGDFMMTCGGRCCCRWSIDVTSNGSSALRRHCFGRISPFIRMLYMFICIIICATIYIYIIYYIYIHREYTYVAGNIPSTRQRLYWKCLRTGSPWAIVSPQVLTGCFVLTRGKEWMYTNDSRLLAAGPSWAMFH